MVPMIVREITAPAAAANRPAFPLIIPGMF
jgi:hypothetical protein